MTLVEKNGVAIKDRLHEHLTTHTSIYQVRYERMEGQVEAHPPLRSRIESLHPCHVRNRARQFQDAVIGTPDMQGIGIAFAIDGVGVVASVVSLSMMKIDGSGAQAKDASTDMNLLTSIRDGMLSVWNEVALCTILLIIAAVSLLFTGPVLVGIPVLVAMRLPEGAAAFGIILSAFRTGAVGPALHIG